MQQRRTERDQYMRRILITGGSGFIGSYLCEKLLDDGNEIICLDNHFTGKKENIRHLMGKSNFEFIRHDIIEPILLEVDWILNLACPASPIHYQYNPVKTVKTNVLGVINMLGLAKRVDSRIMQASTSEIYGDPKQHPQKESYWGYVNPIGIRSCYDEGKRIAETLMMDYHRQNKVDIRIVRIFNTYGPRMRADDGRVVSNFIVQTLQGHEITIYGDGTQTRSFCYVDDLVEVMIKMMKQNKIIGPMNIGNPIEFTIQELAKKIIEITGSKSKVKYLPLPQDDPTQRKPDITLAKKELGWQPKVQLQEGLIKTISYFENSLSTTA